MKRRSVQAIALGVALLAFALAGVQYRRAAALRQQALEAARRGATWLMALEIPLKDPGIPWIVSAIDGEYCHEPRVAEYVAQRFKEFEGRRDPIYTALRALALGGRDEQFEAFSRRWQKFINKGDVVSAMAFGVYCDRMPRPEVVSRTVLSTTSAGYEATHQLLALEYMKQNGCLSPDEEKTLTLTARAIAAEQQQDSVFSDLWAERLAVLLYGDHRQLVETSWIETLIAEQEPSGAWSDPRFPRQFYKTPENPHTTVLAIWALAEYSRACPFR
jgi:hypothetical protein